MPSWQPQSRLAALNVGRLMSAPGRVRFDAFRAARIGPMSTKWVWLPGQLMTAVLSLIACVPTGTLTNLNDNARSGAYLEEPLVPTTVNPGTTATFATLHTS